jgi:phosphoglycolate phosphatase-like HAD superfamily hydrolase
MDGRARVLLWDIDGTILNTNGAGVKPLLNSIYKHTRVLVKYNRDNYSGLTDHQIIKKLLIENNLDSNLEIINKIIFDYENGLEDALSDGNIEVLRDFQNLLPYLEKRFFLHNLIVTGNTHKGATAKLNAVKLNNYFSKKYCSENLQPRNDIVGQAISNFPKGSNFCVIGDTPHDIAGAKHNSIPVIAVATGAYTVDMLKEYEPDACLNPQWDDAQLFTELNRIWHEETN